MGDAANVILLVGHKLPTHPGSLREHFYACSYHATDLVRQSALIGPLNGRLLSRSGLKHVGPPQAPDVQIKFHLASLMPTLSSLPSRKLHALESS